MKTFVLGAMLLVGAMNIGAQSMPLHETHQISVPESIDQAMRKKVSVGGYKLGGYEVSRQTVGAVLQSVTAHFELTCPHKERLVIEAILPSRSGLVDSLSARYHKEGFRLLPIDTVYNDVSNNITVLLDVSNFMVSVLKTSCIRLTEQQVSGGELPVFYFTFSFWLGKDGEWLKTYAKVEKERFVALKF